MPICVGTSGWSYDDWDGPVYPPGIGPGDRLASYAERFATVEIDSTYYRDPSPAIVRGWIEKTRGLPRFEFSVKVPKTLTHEALVDGTDASIEGVASAWRALVADPLAKAGKLGAILLQVSPAVYRSGGALQRLDVALHALRPHACAVELRNHTWHDATPALDPDTVALMDAHGASIVVVDGPSFPTIVAGSARHAFVRFHGRNAERWFQPERYYGDRYDYEYSDAELEPWARRLAELAKRKERVRVYFNNHVAGKAFRNGLTMERMLAGSGAPLVRAESPQRRLF